MVSFHENNSIANEDEETMVIRKIKALMCLRIWKMLTSLTRKLSQAPAQERNGSSHNQWTPSQRYNPARDIILAMNQTFT